MSARRHVFDRIANRRDEREDRCRRCAVTRMQVGILTRTFEVTRWFWLYRKAGGESWMTYYPRCAS